MNDHDPCAAQPATGLPRNLLWIDAAAHRLLQRAARRAPPSLAERLEEEWLADMAARRSSLARLRLAIGCCWAVSVIADEHRAPKVAAATAARGSRSLTAYVPAESSIFSRRSAAVLAILALHALLIYLLATGIVHRIANPAPAPITATFTNDPRTHERPPPLPGPQLGAGTIHPPTRIDRIDAPVVTDPVIGSGPGDAPPPTAPAGSTMRRVPGGPGKGFPNTADFYPDAAIRLDEQGAASVQVCVSAGGRLTSDPTIAQSSGSRRLDGGALALAKAGSGHYRPTTEDGRAVSSCFPVRMRFTLQR